MEVPTGRRGQMLICEGWFASHADSGVPGPHVHLRTNDGRDPVLRTDQLATLTDALAVVSERIERAWAESGDAYAAEVVLRSPDPDDPDVVRRDRVEHLRFLQLVADRLPEVVGLLARAASTDEALDDVAALLGVDPVEVMRRFARFDLLAMTRAAYEKRTGLLEELRG